MKAFREIVLPVAKPGIAASAVLVFIISWSELLFAPILASLTIEAHGIRRGQMTAIGTLKVTPVVIIAHSLLFYTLRQKRGKASWLKTRGGGSHDGKG